VLGAAKAVGIPAKEAPFDFSASAPALVRVAQENSLACLHVDLPERFERSTAPEAYLPTFEAFDTDLLSPVLDEVRTSADAVRLILLGTWRESGWLQRPPALWGAWPPLRAAMAIDSFTEPALRELGDGIAEPERLLIEGNSGT